MSLITQLLRLTDEYERATGVERKTLSWRVFHDSKKLAALKDEGVDIQVKRAEAAILWLHANWPGEAVWPDEIARPEVVSGEAAA